MKILQVAIGEQRDIQEALSDYGDVIYFDWSGKDSQFNQYFTQLVEHHKPQVTFMQIQTPNIITPQAAISAMKYGKVFNWTGDVRTPTPRWFFDIGKHITSTLFTNMHDVEVLKKAGIRSDYLQIGFPTKIFTPEGEKREEAEIIFMGNNVGGFPLSEYRNKIVERLRNIYGNRFKAFGINYPNYSPETNQHEEAKIYRGCKIAINCSHFDYPRYSSDRIFRLMGAGAFCLSHNYKDIDKEFEVGKHLDVFNDIDHLINQINFYLLNEEKRKEIANNGCKLIHENYTWKHRIAELWKRYEL